jgi:hypothetical protein
MTDPPRPRAPQPLLDRLARVPGMGAGRRRLVVLMGQLGDFDSLEYAQALAAAMPRLEAAGIGLLAIALGNTRGADRFCAFTGFPRCALLVDEGPKLHQQLGLYAGLQTPGGAWPALLLMCAGVGSPGTLAEVLRGYSGDRQAPPRLQLPLFDLVGRGYQRPFELATVRLQNMVEVLGRWRTYVPTDAYLTQRGGTYVLEADDTLLYSHRDAGILGFSSTMAQPLSFLEPYLAASPVELA